MLSSVKRRAHRALLLALAAATVSTSCGSTQIELPTEPKAAEYCAIMPDTIGLYVGNPVTQMGYQIGKVKRVTPDGDSVRVDFTVTVKRSFPRDIKAVIRSTSILADRALELVGNPRPGPQLAVGDCIALKNSATPKSLSEIIGSATTFINTLSPADTTNIGDAVHVIDQAIGTNGPGVNTMLTKAARLLDSPDAAIGDIRSIIVNTAQLTATLKELRDPLKQILLDAQVTTKDVAAGAAGAARIVQSVVPIISAAADIEMSLGEDIQFTLDAVAVALRKLSAHAPRIMNLLNPVPWWINTLANHINNRQFEPIRYRPPMYRVRTPDGVAMCNIMNATAPGTCANVQGQPYAVDVALLQYVLTEANRR